MNKKILVWGAVMLGVVFLGLAAYYWLTPAGYLPQWMPGFEANSPHVHFKHGLASLILAIGIFIYAWFASGPKSSTGKEGSDHTDQ